MGFYGNGDRRKPGGCQTFWAFFMSKNIVNGEYGARSLWLSTTVICLFVFCLDANTIAIARAEEKPAETMSKLERTCFAGIFFDTRYG